MHTRIQLDPQAELSLRHGANGDVEILILDPRTDVGSCVIVLTPDQLDAIRALTF